MKRNLKLIALMALGVLAVPSISFAQRNDNDWNRGRNDRRDDWRDNRRDNRRDDWHDNRRDGRQDFVWSGYVDDRVDIIIDGNRIITRTVSGREVEQVRANLMRPLSPRDGEVRNGDIRVSLLQGRGRVYVREQPSRRNGYRTVIRIDDLQAGAAHYRISADW
jgi:hypothetical protein